MLKLIFVLAVLVRTAYLFIIPAGQTPDEIPIFLRTWDTVRQSLGFSAVANIHYSNNEYYYPPLYFYLSAFLIRLLLLLRTVPDTIQQAYVVFYYPLRLLSLCLSVGALALIFKTLEQLKIEKTVKINTMFFMALLPTFAVFSIYPNHNVLLFFLICLFTYFLVTSKNSFFLGSVAGLAILTKDDGMFLFIMYLVWFLTNRSKNWRGAFVFCLASFAFGGWWYAKNLLEIGWFYDRSLFAASLEGFVRPFAFPGYVNFVFSQLLETFVATFGRTNLIRIPGAFYWMSAILAGIALWRLPVKIFLRNRLVFTLFAVFIADLIIFLWINFQLTLQPQGRYFFPSILFIGLALAAGWTRVFGPKYSLFLPVFIFLFGLGINLVSYAVILVSF